MYSSKVFRIHRGGVTADEVLENYRQESTQHGNDIDLLNQSILLLLAGHYRDSMTLSLRVMPLLSTTEVTPDIVDKSMAQSAFLAAAERAKTLFEQAAYEIEGQSTDSSTMSSYFSIMKDLASSQDW